MNEFEAGDSSPNIDHPENVEQNQSDISDNSVIFANLLVAAKQLVAAKLSDLPANCQSQIAGYLSEDDRYSLINVKHLFYIFRQEYFHVVRDLLKAVVSGDEDTVLAMLKANPDLILERSHPERGITTDHCGRKYSNMTAFQIALCTGDDVMIENMLAALPEDYRKRIQSELDNQFSELFPDGYDAHLEAQKQSADEFARDYLAPLISAIKGKGNPNIIKDLNRALIKRDKDESNSELCWALKRFRQGYTQLSLREKIYNPYHLLKMLGIYDSEFDAWYVNNNNPHRWLRLDLFWRQVFGFGLRSASMPIGQALCTGVYYMVVNHRSLIRATTLHNSVNNLKGALFYNDNPICLLGFDFAVDIVGKGCSGSGLMFDGHGFEWFFQSLFRTKTAYLSSYAAEIETRRNVLLCN